MTSDKAAQSLASLKGRRVCVTGADGFIASHLVERLVGLGAQVRALVHYNTLGLAGWLDTLPVREEIEVVAGDVRDADSMRGVVRDMEIVFHLAALIGIPYSYRAPRSYVRTNIEGTLNILSAARELGGPRVVHTSTSEVYGSAQYVPIDEKHPLVGQSPYSASKIGADKIAESFHLSFEVPVVTVRPFNTFGPRQSTRAVIPVVITQCLAGHRVRLGNLDATRDMNYVANTVEGFCLAGAVPEAVGRTLNLGSGREIAIGDLARMIAGIVGTDIDIECDERRLRPEGSEVDRLVADSTLAREVLGWAPHVSLEEGLERTVAWMREHADRYRAGEYTV